MTNPLNLGSTKIPFIELERLRKNLRVHSEDVDTWEKLLNMGYKNLLETGPELIKKIQLLRGLSLMDICVICEIRQCDLEKVMTGNFKITKTTALKLTALGIPAEAFKAI